MIGPYAAVVDKAVERDLDRTSGHSGFIGQDIRTSRFYGLSLPTH